MRNVIFHLRNSPLTAKTLAERSGISEKHLAEISEGITPPTLHDVKKLSTVLNLSVSYLLRETQPQREYDFLFRQGIESDHMSIVIDRFGHFVEGILALKPDKNDVENVREKLIHGDNSFEHAEFLAHAFRVLYFNEEDPIDVLPSLLSDLGFIVKTVSLGKSVEGASAYIKDLPFVFISPSFEPRMLFTLAHELGHILNHHGTGDFFYFDEHISFNRRTQKRDVERFANTFASCLLLPPSAVGKALVKLRERNLMFNKNQIGEIELLQVMRIFNVSFEVVLRRFEDLKLIEQGFASSISQKVKDEYGSSEKRADSLGIPPRKQIIFPEAPGFLISQAVELVSKGDLSLGKAAELLNVPINTILNYRATH